MADYVLSLIDNLGVPHIEIWERSLRRSGFGGEVVLFAYSPDPSLSAWCAEHLVRLLRLDAHPIPPKRHNKERWSLYADFINESKIDERSRIIATDTRDICFQQNPSVWLDDHASDDLILSSEGICYHMDSWNRQHAIDVAGPEIYANLLQNRKVINAGVVAGRPPVFTTFCRDIYARSYDKPDNPSDQIVLNLVIAEQNLPTTTLDDGWACHGTVIALLQKQRPIIVDDEVCTPAGIPYTIVHQYQNVPEWQKAIEELHRA